MSSSYEAVCIQEGYSYEDPTGNWKADGSITLLKGKYNILVDTGAPGDKDALIEGLRRNGLQCEDINYVIGTHGHSDHIGNLNLFPQATFIVSFDISKGNVYSNHDFKSGAVYSIDDGVEVHPSPGHTCSDICVFVENTQHGSLLVAGDLFENENDLKDDSIWKSVSRFPELQMESRERMLAKSPAAIIPGHGPMFYLKDASKEQTGVT